MGNSRSEDIWKRDLIKQFPQFFDGNARILEIGSSIAGNKGLFPAKEYMGLDVAENSGVDVVSIAHEYNPDEPFDVICSFSELEHDMYWEKTLKKMVELTRSGGLIFFSCCYNWAEHGTFRTSPDQSLTTRISKEWGEYYQNRTPADIASVWDCDKLFEKYYLGLNPYDDGLTCFWGIKNE